MTLTTTEAEEFVAHFAEAWRSPTADGHAALFADDVVLVQPLMGRVEGKERCREAFDQLFRLVPDLHAVVHRWSANDEVIFIEFTLKGTFGGKEIAWSAVDRFVVEGGLIKERIAYFDSAPVALAMAASPRGWQRMLRTRFVPKVQRYAEPGT